MAVPVGQYVRMDGGTTLFSGFSIGDTIKITGSSENNGIYTINNIDDSGGNSYMGVTGPRITDNAGDTNCIISNISSKGNKIICLGNEDVGQVDIWSYNDATDEDGDEAVAPSVGTNGWSTSAVYPVLEGSNANFIFTQVDDTVRICDTNQANTSTIK